jgi:hypothetical protein
VTGDQPIGVLGASGAVGRAAAALLVSRAAVRLGVRDLGRVPDVPGEARRVDAREPDEVTAFATGCRVVLGCVAPSGALSAAVAEAVTAAGADYVDVGGDDPAHDAMSVPPGRTAVFSAGMQPGLSGLLPRRAVAGLDAVDAVTVRAGGLDRITPGAAADLLGSLDGSWYGMPLAGWRGGTVVERALRPDVEADLPHFPEPVTAQPILTSEAVRTARRLGAGNAEFWTVFAGRRVLDALTSARSSGASTDASVAALVRAAQLDLGGRTPYQVLTAAVEGRGPTGRAATAVLRAGDTYRLTAAAGVLTVLEVAAGRVGPGVHYAADMLDPTILDRLPDLLPEASLRIVPGAARLVEEGAL